METIEAKFTTLARELDYRFPYLDLHFNLEANSGMVRFFPGHKPSQILELSLHEENSFDLINEAILSLKELLAIYDA
jgi:hypothetical protein